MKKIALILGLLASLIIPAFAHAGARDVSCTATVSDGTLHISGVGFRSAAVSVYVSTDEGIVISDAVMTHEDGLVSVDYPDPGAVTDVMLYASKPVREAHCTVI